MIIKKVIATIVFLLFWLSVFSQNTGIVYPKNQSVLSDSAILITWNACSDADSYSIVIAKSNTTNIIYQEDNILTASKFITLSGQGKYYINVFYNNGGIPISQHNVEFRVFIPYLNNNVAGCFFSDAALSSAGSALDTWVDLSTNSNNAISPTISNNPICKLNDSGLKADSLVFFDGNNDYFLISDIEIAAAYGVFNWSGNQTLFPNYNGLITKNAVTNPSLVFAGNGSNNSSLFRNDAGKSLFGNNMYINNVQTRNFAPFNSYKIVSGRSAISSIFSELIIGGSNGIAGRYWSGNVAELIFYNANPSDSINDLTIEYLRNKYAPLVNLGEDIILTDTYCDTSINAFQPWFVSYNWSTGATDSIIKVSETGLYYVTATDVFGFSSNDSIYVEFPTLVFDDVRLCEFDSTTVFTNLSSVDFNFSWSDGTTGDTLLLHEPGTFNLTVSDVYGCTFITNNFVVLIDSFPSKVNVPDLSLCAGNTLIPLYPEESLSNYLFAWSTGSNDSIITINTTGEYSVTITNNNGCVGVDTSFISVVGISPTCNFYFDTVCVNTSTNFVDVSIPASSNPSDQIVSYVWDFDGLGSSNDVNPVFLFSDAGEYNVILSITSDAGCSSSLNKNVIVKSNPSAAFEVNTACINVELDFVNLSDSVEGFFNSYLWDFNGEATSTLINPSHIFSSDGNIQVELLAISSNGCFDLVTQNIQINETLPLPNTFSLCAPTDGFFTFNNELEFSWNNSINASYYIVNLISINQEVSYLSDSNNTTITLPSADTYSWFVTAYNYCQDSIVSDTFRLNLLAYDAFPDVAFWYNSDSVSQLCDTLYDISNQSNDAVLLLPYEKATVYESTDLNHSTLLFNGNTAYKLQDTAIISTLFTVINWNSDAVYFPYYNGLITKLNATEFPSIIIQGDGINTTSNLRIDANKTLFENKIYINQLNDNDFSPINKPKLFFGQTDFSRSFKDLLIGSASLQPNRFWNGQMGDVIAFSNPVSDSVISVVYQYLRYKYTPPVNLGYDIRIRSGFCDTAITTAYKPWFTSYEWSTGETDSIIHVNRPGLYTVTVTDIFGFESSDDIWVFYPDIINFSDTILCLGDTLKYEYPRDLPYTFLWSNGDTSRYFTSSDAGMHSLEITDNLGCSYQTYFNLQLDSLSAKMSLGDDRSMCSGEVLSPSFGGLSTQHYNYLWMDNSTNSSVTIQNAGEFSLQVSNERGCVAYDTVQITLQGIKPIAAFDAVGVCFGNETPFTDASSSPDGSNIIAWEWDFGDSLFANAQNPSHTYLESGIYRVKLSILTENLCAAETQLQIAVYSLPKAHFSPLTACAKAPLSFVDQSISEYQINHWNWSFNDSNSSTPNSNLQNPIHIFDTAGVYHVELIVSHVFGCSDTLTQAIEIRPGAMADFHANTACKGSPTWFNSSTEVDSWNPIVSYFWEFLPVFRDSLPVSSFRFDTAGVYPVKHRIKLLNGCQSEITKNVKVAPHPQAHFDNPESCLNTPYFITDQSSMPSDSIVSVSWFINNQFYASSHQIEINFPQADTFQIKQIVTSNENCRDTLILPVIIHPVPNANFSMEYDDQSIGNRIVFSNSSTEAQSYYWDFDNGFVSTQYSPIMDFPLEGSYTISLVATNEHSCSDTTSKTISIANPSMDLHLMEADFVHQDNYVNTNIRFANLGNRPVFSLWIDSKINDKTGREKWIGILRPGEIVDYTLHSTTYLPSYKSIDYACISISNDDYPIERNYENNSICISKSEEFALYELFPNPAQDKITLMLNAPSDNTSEILIYYPDGRTAHTPIQKSLKKGINQIQLPIQNLEAGIYLVQIRFEEKMISRKFVVLRK